MVPRRRRRSRSRRLFGLLLFLAVAFLGTTAAWWSWDWVVAQGYLLTMESPGRVRGLQVDRVVDALEIRSGQTIADIGAGTGVFARVFARRTAPDGVVYAVDVNATLVTHLERMAADLGLPNLRAVLARAHDPRIPEPVDLIFICDTLHHIDGRGEYLKTLRHYLKPGGRVAVIDFRETSPHLDALVMPSMQYTVGQLDEWTREAGYAPTARFDFIDDYFFVVYSCDTCPAPEPGGRAPVARAVAEAR